MPTDNIMVPKTNGIDEFPAHWKTTLCGEDFWKDAEDWNNPTNNKIEADRDQGLHTRFPFNIGPEQATRASSVTPTTVESDEVEVPVPEKRSRRFSMSDAFSLNSFTGRSSSSLFAPTRVLELTRRSRSRSRSRPGPCARSFSVTSNVHRRSNSLIRTLNNMWSSKGKEKETEPGEVNPEEIGCAMAFFPPDQATPANPLKEFPGGDLWRALPLDRRTLGLDVFWPTLGREKDNIIKKANKEPDIFPVQEMAPLCSFRNLRSLKITGMMQSYQTYIFMTAWLNTNLEELEIGMALPPLIRRPYVNNWPLIKGGWQLDNSTYGEPVYYGDGAGSLTLTYGISEYLDKICLEKAKIRAMAIGSTHNRLSIRTLILTGVVLDADPFLHWFDPKRLRCIHFKDNCVDAGFWLSHCMQKVSILFPRQVDDKPVVARRVDPLAELKVVEVNKGKKVGEIPFRGPESLKEVIPRNVIVKSEDKKEKKREEEKDEGEGNGE